MNKIAISVAALAISAGSALAADLPSRKAAPLLPPPPPPAPLWTGFYVGLNAGGTWANSNQQTIGAGPVSFTPGFPNGNLPQLNAHLAAFASAASAGGVNSGSNGGFIGGGQIGYNWQLYGSFVAGVEADIQGLTGNSGSGVVSTLAEVGNGNNYVGFHSVRGSLDYIGTVRGRLGWLFTPTLLVYGTGGLAYGGVTLNSASMVYNDDLAAIGTLPASIGGVNYSNTQVGWTAGGGVEWMFMPNWSAKVEYLYYDLGSVTQNFALASVNAVAPESALFGGQVRARVNGNIVRAGLNYHFNWGSPAPVIAKY